MFFAMIVQTLNWKLYNHGIRKYSNSVIDLFSAVRTIFCAWASKRAGIKRKTLCGKDFSLVLK